MIKKEDLVALSEGERFISGIYNYCDRWCDRCSFTSRCMHFAASKKAHSELESFDIENGIERSIAAWGELRRCFFQHQREIADILVLLEALRRNVEDAFPAARDFIRPGFDRVNLNG